MRITNVFASIKGFKTTYSHWLYPDPKTTLPFQRVSSCMTFHQFRTTLSLTHPPDGGSILVALWYDAKGDWQKAHEIVQDLETREAAWIHAYLHRKEGDLSNAQYWYHRAGQSLPQGSLEQEWEMIARRFTG